MADYDNFAALYNSAMGERGDKAHQTQIDPFIYQIVGNPQGKIICDLGCGNGYMAREFARKGAKVYASDTSQELIKIAQSNSGNLDIQYIVRSAEDLSTYENGLFDVVVMNMTIHYLGELAKLFSEVSRVLKPNGLFVFSTNHFFRPNYPYSEWVLGNIDGQEKLFIKTTDYLIKRKSKVISPWDKKTILTIFNHTLGEMVNSMSDYNLLIFKVFEPESVVSDMLFSEELQKSHHIPDYLIVGAKKVAK